MARPWRSVLVIASLAIAAGCAKGQFGPSASTPVNPAPRELDRLTVDERRDIISRAQVWHPIDTAKLNLLAGPRDEGAFAFNAPVTCDYAYPDKPLGGVTPKFECAVKDGDVVKVKYGENNGEVYAEVASSRLFWALGFPADRMYPARVTCRNCPADPFKESKEEWHLGKSATVSDKLFDPATIERPYPGEEVEVPGYEGWAWPELELVDAESGGAPRAHVDALKLLAVFIQHVDSKPGQQAIVCANGAVSRDRQGNASCETPLLMIRDLGSSFGQARRMSFPKMKLDSWRVVPIWRDPATCEGDLTRSLVGNLEHPVISEAGRRFLASRMMLLSDRQIRDLFTAARVERRGDTTKDADGDSRPVTVDDWVAAFKAKRSQITEHRCPS